MAVVGPLRVTFRLLLGSIDLLMITLLFLLPQQVPERTHLPCAPEDALD